MIQSHAIEPRIVAVSKDNSGRNTDFRRTAPRLMLFDDPGGAAARVYRVERTPYAFFIENGRVGSHGVTNNAEHIRDLVDGRMSLRDSGAWQAFEDPGNDNGLTREISGVQVMVPGHDK